MITKNDLLKSALREVRIAKQLLTKMPKDAWDYRPSEDQRSTLELARYLCAVGQGCTHAGKDQSFQWFGDNNERLQALTAEQIPAELDKEIDEMQRLFDGISEDDFQNKVVTVGDMGTYQLSDWLMETTLKFLSAYKLQLFLYLKSAGASDLNTMDAWQDDGTLSS